MLRATPWSTGDGLRLGLEAGGAAVAPGMDEFYGRNMPAPPARVARGGLRARSRSSTRRTRRCATRDGEVYEPRTWSEIDVVQWTARQPRRARLVRGRATTRSASACATAPSREMIEAARARRRAGRAPRRRRTVGRGRGRRSRRRSAACASTTRAQAAAGRVRVRGGRRAASRPAATRAGSRRRSCSGGSRRDSALGE